MLTDQTNYQIYLAPLQGFTDFIYRKAHAEIIGGIDKYFCPYISLGKQDEIKNSQLKDILPENNAGINLVPQVLFSDAREFRKLCKQLISYGYSEINLNLGCPYPMVTNRGRGAALLQQPELLKEILDIAFTEFDILFSVKLRSGFSSETDIISIIEILNRFPVSEIIYHPRLAKQMYKGEVNIELFQKIKGISHHPLIFNGDILRVSDIHRVQSSIQGQYSWMIGRGVLKNPSLPLLIKGAQTGTNNATLLLFHDRLFDYYSTRLEGSSHLLQKMEQFWSYFSYSFSDPHKVFKLIKKTGTIEKYKNALNKIFSEYVVKPNGRSATIF